MQLNYRENCHDYYSYNNVDVRRNIKLMIFTQAVVDINSFTRDGKYHFRVLFTLLLSDIFILLNYVLIYLLKKNLGRNVPCFTFLQMLEYCMQSTNLIKKM